MATVPDHFLKEHFWEHTAKVHVIRIFMWTFGALLAMHLLVEQFQLAGWIQENTLIVLLASSVVQDGHGMLPLLADPRLDFLRIKAINFGVGLLLGLAGYLTGWQRTACGCAQEPLCGIHPSDIVQIVRNVDQRGNLSQVLLLSGRLYGSS
jgi:hypothetical protein